MIYSEKATKICRDLQTFFELTKFCQSFLKILSYFCGLLRIYELYSNCLGSGGGRWVLVFCPVWILSVLFEFKFSSLYDTGPLLGILIRWCEYKGTLGLPIVLGTSKSVDAKKYCLTILWVTSTHGTHSNTTLVKWKWSTSLASGNEWYFVTKIVLNYCEKKLFQWFRKTFEIQSWRPRICKIFEIIRTIYSNSKRSEQFLVTKCFLTCSWRFLISNKLEQFKFKWEKLENAVHFIGFK